MTVVITGKIVWSPFFLLTGLRKEVTSLLLTFIA